MEWNIIDLPIVQLYGNLSLGYTPVFLELVDVFRKNGYKRILDLGSGYGKHSIFLSQQGFDVTSVDIDDKAIAWMENYIAENKINNINVIKADINDLPLGNDTFDAVICSSVIHHQGEQGIIKTILEIHRVLKPCGCCLADFISTEDESFGLGKKIERNTYVGSRAGEEDVPHYYTDPYELRSIFTGFVTIKIMQNEYHFRMNRGNTSQSRMLDVIAYK